MKMLVSIAVLALIAATQCSAAAVTTWSYDQLAANGPANWKDGYPTCGGLRQSPVDISNVQLKSLGSIVFTNYAVEEGLFKLFNNGHAAEVELEEHITISGAGLPGTYRLAQFHMHFGSSDNKGSEHTVNSQAYPLEIHLVHYNEKYPDVTTALTDPSGIAVLGVFVKVGSFNAALDAIISQLPNIQSEGAETHLPAIAVQNLLPSDKRAYFRYSGSLTTPGCAESVIWTVFKHPIEISAAQMAKFRDLSVVNNFRPTQPLNSRVVQLNL